APSVRETRDGQSWTASRQRAGPASCLHPVETLQGLVAELSGAGRRSSQLLVTIFHKREHPGPRKLTPAGLNVLKLSYPRLVLRLPRLPCAQHKGDPVSPMLRT